MNSDSDGGLDFDDLLERELRRRVGGLWGPSPRVGQAAYRAAAATGGKRMPLLSSLTAAASSKAAIGLAAAALVVGGGSAAAAVASDSANPAAWGQTVKAAVGICESKADASGQHGIGQCVSAVAKKNGPEERAEHAASAARQETPTGASSGHKTGSSTDHPTGAPTSHPGGKPTGVPAGPPASLPPASGGTHPTGPPVVPPSPR